MTVTVTPAPSTSPPNKYGGDRTAFDTAMQAHLTWQADSLVTQLNEQNAENNTINANVNTKEASAAAYAASAQANAATAAANTQAPLWVSGTTYALGDAVYSPLNYRIYRCKVAGTSTTDPSVDTTNWGAALLDIATDYPTIRPTLNLDWINQDAIDPRITVTRASTKTRVNAKGLIETLPANTVAVDYDPVTLERKGVLIEAQRTNLLTYSEQFDNAAWVKNGSTITANATVSPDGTTTADNVVENTDASIHIVRNQFAFLASTTYTASLFIKSGERTSGTFLVLDNASNIGSWHINLLTGEIVAGSSSLSTTATVSNVGDGWWRVVVTFTSTSAPSSSYFDFRMSDAWPIVSNTGSSYTGDGTSGLYIWGAQLEAGSNPSSYIPTTSAQVTRAADSLTIDGANFQSFYNQSEGSFVADYTTGGGVVASKEIINASDGTGVNVIQMRYGSGSHAQFQSMVGSVSQASMAPTGYSSENTTYKRAISYKTDEFQQAINGVIPTVADTSGSVPTVSRMDIGASYAGANVFGGYIRRLAYYNKALTSEQLQALTQS